MKILKRYNPKTKSIEDWRIPPDWNVTTISNPRFRCRCARCGNFISERGKYASIEIMDEHGFSYMVCGACHHTEMKNRENSGVSPWRIR